MNKTFKRAAWAVAAAAATLLGCWLFGFDFDERGHRAGFVYLWTLLAALGGWALA